MPKGRPSSVVMFWLGALLAIGAAAMLTTPARVWYHRARLQSLHSYEAVVVTVQDNWLNPRYWRWRVLERGRSQEQQLALRGRRFLEHLEALVALGYYERHEFNLREPWDPLESPDWLVRLIVKSTRHSTTNHYRDWPQISLVRSPSNTIVVRISAPTPVIREWQSTIREHCRAD